MSAGSSFHPNLFSIFLMFVCCESETVRSSEVKTVSEKRVEVSVYTCCLGSAYRIVPHEAPNDTPRPTNPDTNLELFAANRPFITADTPGSGSY
ncbi:hypothetical protein RRG08_059157 [Elysia crispata]|uniref:Secreted protein n=1 Tax=Elysia crispata TaxID=231223 RepID=A0AAE1DNH9_9GAST|nr:hypothetical protein RRG08_059157 [Elysia crispata]